MGDYTNALDLQNAKDLGAGATQDSGWKLAQMLQQQAQMAQQQKQFQQGQQHDSDMQNQKAQLGQQEQGRNIDLAKGIVEDQAKAGRSVNAKIGNVDISQKEDSPLKYMLHSQQQGAKAQQHAYDIYMKAFPDVQKRTQSAQEALEAINDPQQVGSVGQAKTLMIKNLGMNRYNQQEGNALVPQQFAQIIHGIYNGIGGDSNPLTDTQRQALNSVFQGGLSTARKQHEMAKQNALGSYMDSGVADMNVAQQFKSSVGADFDKQLDAITEKYKKVPTTVGYQQPPPGSQASQPQSMVDKLKSFFGGGSPAQGSAPMSFEEFKAKKAAGQIK